MFYLLSLLMGVLISVMVAFNGGLTERYGLYSATVIIHIVGLLIITAIVWMKREKFFPKRFPWYLYLGGAIGVLTTVFNNFAFGRISVSAILALGLLGQSITGLAVDHNGLFGMKKYPLTKDKLLGLALIIAGIASMTTSFEAAAVIVSFIAGVNIVLSRTLNARLADLTSVRVSSFYNYFVGLFVAIIAFLLLGGNEFAPGGAVPIQNWYIYLGGALGLAIVLLANILVVKVSAFYLTLFVFIGQVFSGVLIDMAITQTVSTRNILGGILVTAGLCVNLLIDRKRQSVDA
ncbi:MAG: DMT family transporter [Oscillospiraceae bacterium]|nr:DMT family transporter [Oscillospiraceae bacterium]MCL2279705.1 DMT family transporter [Oscillospiraceae bacterium]